MSPTAARPDPQKAREREQRPILTGTECFQAVVIGVLSAGMLIFVPFSWNAATSGRNLTQSVAPEPQEGAKLQDFAVPESFVYLQVRGEIPVENDPDSEYPVRLTYILGSQPDQPDPNIPEAFAELRGNLRKLPETWISEVFRIPVNVFPYSRTFREVSGPGAKSLPTSTTTQEWGMDHLDFSDCLHMRIPEVRKPIRLHITRR